jgi:hypothetical protein
MNLMVSSENSWTDNAERKAELARAAIARAEEIKAERESRKAMVMEEINSTKPGKNIIGWPRKTRA